MAAGVLPPWGTTSDVHFSKILMGPFFENHDKINIYKNIPAFVKKGPQCFLRKPTSRALQGPSSTGGGRPFSPVAGKDFGRLPPGASSGPIDGAGADAEGTPVGEGKRGGHEAEGWERARDASAARSAARCRASGAAALRRRTPSCRPPSDCFAEGAPVCGSSYFQFGSCVLHIPP
jgi:hypothetical protein